jgi:hypothetical protein
MSDTFQAVNLGESDDTRASFDDRQVRPSASQTHGKSNPGAQMRK